jgi:hypothetical protein
VLADCPGWTSVPTSSVGQPGEPSPFVTSSSAYVRPCPEPMKRMCTCVVIARYRVARFSAEQARHASKARRSGDGQSRQLHSLLCGLVCLVRRQLRVSLRVSSPSATVASSTVSIGGNAHVLLVPLRQVNAYLAAGLRRSAYVLIRSASSRICFRCSEGLGWVRVRAICCESHVCVNS